MKMLTIFSITFNTQIRYNADVLYPLEEYGDLHPSHNHLDIHLKSLLEGGGEWT